MKFDHQLAQTLLRSLDLASLFSQALGWSMPNSDTIATAIATRAFKQRYRCHCIAQRGLAAVWQVKLSSTAQLTPKLRHRLYQTVSQQQTQPLLIFVDRQLSKSYWYQEQRLGEQTVACSWLYISGQPLECWQVRLQKLAAYDGTGPFSLLPDWRPPAEQATLTATFERQHDQLAAAIEGISNAADRQWYATLLLSRLIFMFSLQRRGLLDRGDIWYLHNKLGQSQQRGRDLFFQQILRPLFTQGFSLPLVERPKSVCAALGSLPYLGNAFYTHPLEQQYPAIAIPDAPFEAILVWFGEPIWQSILNPWQSAALSQLFEQHVLHRTSDGYPANPRLVEQCCDRALDQHILTQLGSAADASASEESLSDLLFQGDLAHCRWLIQEALPSLRILDPACGAGTFLLASLQRLADVYCVLIGHLTQHRDAQLDIWLSGLRAEQPSLMQGIYRRLLKNNLYGVDLLRAAVEMTQLQLLISLSAIAQQPAEVELLPNLDFNILAGNSLVGFIRIDERGFDRIKTKGSDAALQGNLLQPLAADSYRTILAEKHISLEHYQSQTSLLKELQGIPQYAQREFLRDHINRLDRKAQNKLNELLLNEFSQKLGIQYRETQLSDRPARRLLRVEDLELLYPLHWGYFFNAVIAKGGFNVILSAPPWGGFKPTTDEFLQQFQDMAARREISADTLKTSKRSLLETDAELVNAWLFYQSQYSFVTDFFYRTEQYAHQAPRSDGQRSRTQLRLDWLFAERCFNLLSPGGVCALVIPDELSQSARGVCLRSRLERDDSLHFSAPLPPADRALPSFCWLQFKKGRP
ncbi:MAG: hypothetical protein F6J97_19940 [Leptolyngbya sp. SIO4C1]|nr:hypothetical protein [Leptolyngbya sp. SIO4C1]